MPGGTKDGTRCHILLLVEFDKESIEKAGYETITPVIVTNSYDYKDILSLIDRDIEEQDEIIKTLI